MSQIGVEGGVISQENGGIGRINLRDPSDEVFRKMDIVFGGFKPTDPSGKCSFKNDLDGHLRHYQSYNGGMNFVVAHVDNSLVVGTAASEEREGFRTFNRGAAELVQQLLEKHCGSCDVSPVGRGTLLTVGNISSERVYEVAPVVLNVLPYPYLGGEIVAR